MVGNESLARAQFASTFTLPDEVLTRTSTAPEPPAKVARRFSKVPGKSLRIPPELVLAVPEISVPGGSSRVTLPELASASIEALGGIDSH